jgi:periplasmic protein TonB
MKTPSILLLALIPLFALLSSGAPKISEKPSFTGEYIQKEDADQAPRPIKRSFPVYPFELKRKGVSGQVTLVFIVDTKGKPTQIQVSSATNKQFINPALDALEEWKFSPAMKDGQPVACFMVQPFVFSINDH